MNKSAKLLSVMAVAVAVLLSTTTGFTQAADNEEEMEKISILGSRTAPRSVVDSAVPLDIIFINEFEEQGATDLASMLETLVPSFNVVDFPLSDAASMVRPANLRGMSSDHTLVLVNGKRRHRASVISFLGNGTSNGSQGPDISTIPTIALKQIEILRDGAAAQYGADAIAGVINFVLKDYSEGGELQAKLGSFYEGDGNTIQVAGNWGMALSENGFANVSFEYRDFDMTNRSVQRSDAAALIEAGNTHVADPAQNWGSPEVKNDIKLFLNSGMDLNSQMQTYLFGNYAQRTVTGGFYFRNPHTRGGIFNGGDGNLLVGDLDGAGGIDCPTVPTGDNVLDSDAYKQIADNTTDIGKNCFAFNERFPGGFTPKFGGDITETSLVAGLKGETSEELRYDLSVSWGNHQVDHVISNTINPSLGPDSPTSFKPGSYIQDEKAINLDLVKNVDGFMGLDTFSLAGGLEYRQESFEGVAGDLKSYEVGPLVDQGFGIGSNGFPGLSEKYAGKEDRTSMAAYLDAELYPMDDLLLAFALRHENFSDFGDATIGKISSYYNLSDQWALRGAVATGFKSPTIGQTTVRNVTTNFKCIDHDNDGECEDRRLVDRVNLPPDNPVSALKGATPLMPETSQHITAGLVSEMGNDLFFTLDYFRIQLKDRISLSSGIGLTPEDVATLEEQGVQDAASLGEVSFFTNDFSTLTQGIDVVASYEANEMFTGKTKFLLAFNWTETKVEKIKVFDENGKGKVKDVADIGADDKRNIGEDRVRTIEENLPKYRLSLTGDHMRGKWRFLTRLNYFSEAVEELYGYYIDLDSKYTVDLEVSYRFHEHLRFVLGAQNLLDEKPKRIDDLNLDEDYNTYGSKYSTTSPVGFNGGFYYTRLSYRF